MREAMYRAEVGDDVYGEDPTVRTVEETASPPSARARRRLFLLSGTMGNLVGILSQTRRGHDVLVGEHAHVYLNELGVMAPWGLPAQPPSPARGGC